MQAAIRFSFSSRDKRQSQIVSMHILSTQKAAKNISRFHCCKSVVFIDTNCMTVPRLRVRFKRLNIFCTTIYNAVDIVFHMIFQLPVANIQPGKPQIIQGYREMRRLLAFSFQWSQMQGILPAHVLKFYTTCNCRVNILPLQLAVHKLLIIAKVVSLSNQGGSGNENVTQQQD